ncbi:MAG TPA: hypothetical protein PL105_25090, partial [Caldilineaceae bacterium]|nr:hypothetical protein [Caldilineaceae bacterium]
VVSDTLSANLTYVNGTAKMNGAALSDDFVGATRFPLDEGGIVINSLDVDESAVFVYSTTVGNTGQVSNSAQSTYGFQTLSVQLDVPVDQGNLTACAVDFITGLGGASATVYLANGTVFVRLTDGDKNSSGGQDTVQVSVRNPTNNDRETVTLTETTGSSGVFEGSLPSSTTGGQSVEDGTLYAQAGQSLGVSFTDTQCGDSCTDATPPVFTVPSQMKVLYLSENGSGSLAQNLDRIDPMATGDNTTSQSPVLTALSTSTVVAATTTSGSSASVASGGTLSFSHTPGTGSNRLLLVAVSIGNTGVSDETAPGTVTGVTFGGTPMTLVNTVHSGFAVRSYIYRLINPTASPSANIVITVGSKTSGVIASATTFTGVHQTTPLGTPASFTSNAYTISGTVASAAGELVYSTAAVDEYPSTPRRK